MLKDESKVWTYRISLEFVINWKVRPRNSYRRKSIQDRENRVQMKRLILNFLQSKTLRKVHECREKPFLVVSSRHLGHETHELGWAFSRSLQSEIPVRQVSVAVLRLPRETLPVTKIVTRLTTRGSMLTIHLVISKSSQALLEPRPRTSLWTKT